MFRRITVFIALTASLFVAGCGGGSSPTPDAVVAELRAQLPAIMRRAATSQDAVEQLFTLAESSYPQYFPTQETTHTYDAFAYRYYPTAGTYVGVVTGTSEVYIQANVYVMGGPFGSSPLSVGPLSQFVDTGGGGSNPPALTGTGTTTFTILYAGTHVGIDARVATATFNSNNTLKSYNFSADEAPDIGTNTVADSTGTSNAQVGRWNNGTMAGRFYSLVTNTTTFSMTANQGFHYVVANSPSTQPCGGTSTYTLAAATRPTLDDGSSAPGTWDSLTVTVAFHSNHQHTYTVNGAITIDGSTRNFSGTSTTAMFQNTAFMSVNGTSGTSGSAGFYATFAAPDASEMGAAFSGLGANGSFTKGVRAAARLTRSANSATACP